MSAVAEKEPYDAIIVGAGAAGIGIAITLQDAGIENFLVLERHTLGASFDRWPAETRFISPSFPTNSIGMLDINSVALGTSPAHALDEEHPTGEEYARYLRSVAEHYEVPVRQHVAVESIGKKQGVFHLLSSQGEFRSKNVIWAGGEFQFPKLNGFVGSHLCIHTSRISSYHSLEGETLLSLVAMRVVLMPLITLP